MSLKPCPFCGCEAVQWEDNAWQDRYVVECRNCGTSKRSEYGFDRAIEEWNTRYATKEDLCQD